MSLTKQQIETANQMHQSGVSWEIIAALLKTDTNKLRKGRKYYNNE